MPSIQKIALPLLLSLVCACKSSTGKVTPPGSSAFTLHYHRVMNDYTGWTVQTSAGAVEPSVTATTDGFGAVYALTLKGGATALSFTLANGATVDAAGPLSVDVSGAVREAWVISGYAEAFPRKLPAIPGPDQVAVYYTRADKTYDGWGLHTWGDVKVETAWQAPLSPSGIDPELGAGFVINVKPGGDQINVIAHKGDAKDPGPDMSWKRSVLGDLVFLSSGSTRLTSTPQKLSLISGASAHLAARDTLAWNVTDVAAASFELRYSATADIVATATNVTGGATIALTPRPAGLGTALEAKAPYLAGSRAFDIAPADLAKLKDALHGQLVAVAHKADGTTFKATQVQTALAMDDLYAYDGPLGVRFAGVAGAPTFTLWSPPAQAVSLHVYDANKAEVAGSPVAMTASAGVWTATGSAAWYGGYYRYEVSVYHPVSGRIEKVLVTDPYAVNLSTNGLYAQIVDLDDPATQPSGWTTFTKPPLAAATDIVAYEGHIRDFSVFDATVPADHRGKYLAFTDIGSNGMKHLAALSSAGLTHLHLLPFFDIATVDEDPANRVDITDGFDKLCAKNPSVPAATCTQYGTQVIKDVLAGLPGDSDQQQAIEGWLHAIDSFNWGYDPFHYGAPEGSYASTAEGTAKIVELRKMVMGLAAVNLRLVMDVVYNHTNASGLGDKSVLDKVVPGYYHRLDPDSGFVLTSSCCANTATEHHMMGRLMNDTLVRWARDYKMDGFRFDLMGLHLKADMVAAQAALAALTVAHDGVDGSKIYLYGEGWDMGELAKNQRGFNANQANMAGTGIGTFNDRIRDAVRGGSAFDTGTDLVTRQGFATGLFTDPNDQTAADPAAHDLLLLETDWIKASMAGGVRDFVMQAASGTTIAAGGIGYNGASSGYTLSPQESINYVSAHDNQTLWDDAQYKLPKATSTADRVRVHDLALDTILLGEGIPFVHMGDDLLRSKSEDKNSYDAGDWFNRIDWTMATNGWKIGLPQAGDNVKDWGLTKSIFALAPAAVGAADIAFASKHFQEMLKVRQQSPLLRLRTGADVKKRVDFPNAGPTQVPGLLVMTITDGACAGADLDPARDAMVVIINADKQAHDYSIAGATGFTLHSVLQGSADSVVKTAGFSAGKFTVPARTSAVFEQLQTGAQGAGLACNTRVSGT